MIAKFYLFCKIIFSIEFLEIVSMFRKNSDLNSSSFLKSYDLWRKFFLSNTEFFI